jgi:glucosyl-dolichyl phosphate glucuronosyltransferase
MSLISIIICTRNRCKDLRISIGTLEYVDIPYDVCVEVLVVDNGSTDRTRHVVESARIQGMSVKYVFEPQVGLSVARNTGVRESRGAILLFTDDDQRLPHNWIEGMCRPIINGQAQAVRGGIRLAQHLNRPELRRLQRASLVSTADMYPESPESLIGANMAIAKSVFATIPAFDVELGGGALGYSEEALLSYQMHKSGFRIACALDVEVEHHFSQSRLSREYFLGSAAERGRSEAYIRHHWEHAKIPALILKLAKAQLRLRWCRLKDSKARVKASYGVSDAEMLHTEEIAFYQAYLRERKRPHNYERFGNYVLPRSCDPAVELGFARELEQASGDSKDATFLQRPLTDFKFSAGHDGHATGDGRASEPIESLPTDSEADLHSAKDTG